MKNMTKKYNVRMRFELVTVSDNEYVIQCDKDTFRTKMNYDEYIYESKVVLGL